MFLQEFLNIIPRPPL